MTDMDDDKFIDELVADMDKKTVKKMNKLDGLRFYLAGPIDAAKDDGVGWRRALTPWLKRRKIKVLTLVISRLLTPLTKKSKAKSKKMMELKESGRYFELAQQMRDIVHVDLRMVRCIGWSYCLSRPWNSDVWYISRVD